MKKIPEYGLSEFIHNDHSFFYSNDLKTHLQSHQFVNAPHSHSTYITILFTSGTGQHTIDFQQYDVNPGSVFLLNPGQVHSWTLSEDSDGFVFFHTREFYNSIYQNRTLEDFPFFYLSQNYPVIELSGQALEKILFLFREINEEIHSNRFDTALKAGSLTDLLYIELARHYESKQKVGQNENQFRIRTLLKLIDTHFKEKKHPADYADMMNMSLRHLSRICNEVKHLSTTDLIQQRVLLEARRLLTYSALSVAEVAYDLGYEDVSYFIRLFKKHEGKTPKEFRTES